MLQVLQEILVLKEVEDHKEFKVRQEQLDQPEPKEVEDLRVRQVIQELQVLLVLKDQEVPKEVWVLQVLQEPQELKVQEVLKE